MKSPVELGKWRMWNRCFQKNTKQITIGNRFEEEGFYPEEL